ncbi:hypothetical protein [Pyrococcus yayanosii]|nr:hypothetical protein [Pyrococcus yayanosii]
MGVINRGKRRFRKVLIESGLPKDVVEGLVEKFDPTRPLKKAFRKFIYWP